VADDAPDGRVVAAADAIDLLGQAGRCLHEAGVQLVALGEPVEVGEAHAVIEVVGAGGQDVMVGRRHLARHHRLDGGVEEHRRQPVQQIAEGLAIAKRKARASRGGGLDGGCERFGRHINHELARRQRVVGAGVDPDQLGVVDDRRAARVRQRRGVTDQRVERPAQRQVVTMALVVIDVAAGQRRLVEVPGQDLGRRRQGVEPVGVVLHHRRLADPLEQIGSLGRGRSRRCRHPGTCTVSFIWGIATCQPSAVPMAILSASIACGSPCTR
jgi:hypothetical protein